MRILYPVTVWLDRTVMPAGSDGSACPAIVTRPVAPNIAGPPASAGILASPDFRASERPDRFRALVRLPSPT